MSGQFYNAARGRVTLLILEHHQLSVPRLYKKHRDDRVYIGSAMPGPLAHVKLENYQSSQRSWRQRSRGSSRS